MIRNVYKSRLPSVNFFFKNGLQGAFMLGRYETSDETQIAELEAEVKSGHPHIYIDPAEKEIDTEAPTPLEIIKAEAYKQARADLLASGLMSDKVSFSEQGEFKDSVTNTTTIAEAAMGSDGGSASIAAAAASAVGTSAGGASLMPASSMAAALANLKAK